MLELELGRVLAIDPVPFDLYLVDQWHILPYQDSRLGVLRLFMPLLVA